MSTFHDERRRRIRGSSAASSEGWDQEEAEAARTEPGPPPRRRHRTLRRRPAAAAAWVLFASFCITTPDDGGFAEPLGGRGPTSSQGARGRIRGLMGAHAFVSRPSASMVVGAGRRRLAPLAPAAGLGWDAAAGIEGRGTPAFPPITSTALSIHPGGPSPSSSAEDDETGEGGGGRFYDDDGGGGELLDFELDEDDFEKGGGDDVGGIGSKFGDGGIGVASSSSGAGAGTGGREADVGVGDGEPLRRQLEEQRRQIDMLMRIMKTGGGGSNNPTTTGPLSNARQPWETPIASARRERQSQEQPRLLASQLAPLRAMLFIDGTWLYYSVHQRRDNECPIIRRFGKGWQHYYRFDWAALPRIVCEEMQQQQIDQGWSSASAGPGGGVDARQGPGNPDDGGGPPAPLVGGRPVEIVRASVYTSYNRSTDKHSLRAKMFEEMGAANYDVHIMETMGKGEKCVDIQLAVEMLHYATVPNAYDVAILLSGDKDFIPAMVRTRQKGKQVAVVSMRRGCNRALYESPHVKDYAVVWLDNFLERLIKPIDRASIERKEGLVSSVTMMKFREPCTDLVCAVTLAEIHYSSHQSPLPPQKVMYDFVTRSGSRKVSSRDIGRYLKSVEIGNGRGGTTNMLEQLKDVHGGLKHFLAQHSSVFRIFELTPEESRGRDPRDKSFWVEVTDDETADNILSKKAETTNFSDVEEKFLEEYTDEVDNEEFAYYHTLADDSASFETPKEVYGINRQPYTVNGEDRDAHSQGIHVEKGGTPSSAAKMELPADLLIDYTTYTVVKLKEVCRERGLPVSGPKAVLLQRVQDDVTSRILTLQRQQDEQERQKQHAKTQTLQPAKQMYTVNPRMHRSRMGGTRLGSKGHDGPSATVDPAVTKHLETLVGEYITASGGQAGSRDVGRYLAANASSKGSGSDASSMGREESALSELKEHYGSLINFIQRRPDSFVKLNGDPVRYGDEYGFPIRLR